MTGTFGTGDGSATILIADGGKLTTGTAILSQLPVSNMVMTITGIDSSGIHSSFDVPDPTRTMYLGTGGSAVANIENGGQINVANRIVIAADSTSTTTVNIGAAAGFAAKAPGFINTPSVIFGDGNGRIVFNHTDNNDNSYHFTPAVSGRGDIEVYAGKTTLTAINSYSGATLVAGGTLRAGIAGAFSASSAHTIAANGSLDLQNFDQQILSLSNAGSIRFGATPGTILTTGNYVGNGGMLAINAVLGNDSSPSDKLMIDGGAAIGSSFIAVANHGGAGALTTGNGILVIEVTNGATTSASIFALSGRVAAGAYDYLLYAGGDVTSGGDPNDQNWYLRSTISSPEPGPGEPEPAPIPNIRPEVAIAMVLPPLAIEHGYAMLDTMHERIGETWLRPSTPAYEERTVRGKNGRVMTMRVPVSETTSDRSRWFSGTWARVIGDRGFQDNGSFFRRGPEYDYTFSGLQAGANVFAYEHADGSLDRAGFYAGIGQISADVKGVLGARAGSVDMDAYTIGGYWTHHAASGWYTDAVAQGTFYSADARSIHGQRFEPDGFGLTASLEGGYAFQLGKGFTIEPQAQLAYQTVSFDSVGDAYGLFSFDDDDSLRGRLGVRLTKTWNTAEETKPRLITAWLRANVWHEFLGDSKIAVSNLQGVHSATLSSPIGGTWAEIGAGLSGQVSDGISLFTTGAYNHSLDNKGRKAWDGRLGVSVKW